MLVFNKPSRECTDETCRLAIERAMKENLNICSATTSGASGARICEIAKEMQFGGKLVLVSHAFGSREPGKNAMLPEHRAAMEAYGATIVTAAHALSGVERAMSGQWHGVYPAEIMASTLRLLSAGIKVVVEIGSMALDNGALPHGEAMVCIGGTGGGLDTAVIMHAAHANKIFETKIHEILCMPY